MTFKPLTELTLPVTSLPRGGYLVDTNAGYIQFGSPPETLKDTIFLPKGVPYYFVLPMEHFHPSVGMSVAEIEFPIYYNFFLKKKKTTIYVQPDHIENLKIVLQEAIFGPQQLNIAPEIVDPEVHGIPPIHNEIAYFRAGRTLDDMVDLKPIISEGFWIEKVFVKPQSGGGFLVQEEGRETLAIPAEMNFQAVFELGDTQAEPFKPPLLGITCLGPSHGFDPYQNTSGFILWINKIGIMVDPPVNSTFWLSQSNVNPKLIDSVILTHCHADHDAGTFQKILEEFRIKIYTTPTVMQSFLRKYSALTRIPASRLMEMFDFCPVMIHSPVNIHGAIFHFFYTLHSIPTVGFRFVYRNRTFVYSSDHLNHPPTIEKLYQDGVIDEKRREELLNFPWESDIIYHEAGIPPLHTPVSYLNSLPVELQKKITVYHIAEKDFPKETYLTLARFGIASTLYPQVDTYRFEEAYEILDAFSRIEVFRGLPFERVKDLLLVVKKEHFSRGDIIIQKGTKGDKFYLILSGNVVIEDEDDEKNRKVYGNYEYFGEISLVEDTPRKATVKALTNVDAFVIEKEAFLRLVEGTSILEKIRHIARLRNGETWAVIRANPYFKKLTSAQITDLEEILHRVELQKGAVLVEGGKSCEWVYILARGEVEGDNGEKISQMGAFVGDPVCVREKGISEVTYRVKTLAILYRMLARDFIRFLDHNPGVWMHMVFGG
ncbi:cAMP/cGMP-dependent 3',5'-cyclic-AMP/GMP phosphodiesterase [Thermospira aquatica]|uniref:cAMP/cGMP-dependent 3',5'-cyclic-AMP/GMP phosphodiesterase n=1 Tax=Thermospira aquatica TaxID=2828656 RepID=A0AAX3BBE5_9SPIR|nr:cAMP/cGMP-dependent 3',5'-cyclic-AMP/GMP phosphodiesterase [Thermospira aquatica]URA09461.1 cAMP/cGMP-dependent 3',5'-cyclic-AMP/GMP phosphodiesterase [Thermospira aquatica]